MQDQELTGWFELSDQKPWVDGVYEVQRHRYGYSGQFSLFKNGRFHEVAVDGANSAMRFAEKCGVGDGDDVVRWRGLASDPNAKPKPKRSSNPKVTRYVVIDVMKGEPVASFHTRDAAVDYSERMAWPRIKRVRHRSPE